MQAVVDDIYPCQFTSSGVKPVVWSREMEITLLIKKLFFFPFFFLQYEAYSYHEKRRIVLLQIDDRYKLALAQYNAFICRIGAIISGFCRLVGR